MLIVSTVTVHNHYVKEIEETEEVDAEWVTVPPTQPKQVDAEWLTVPAQLHLAKHSNYQPHESLRVCIFLLDVL